MKTIKLSFLIFSILLSSSAFSQSLNEKILMDNSSNIYVVAQKNCPNDTDIGGMKFNSSGTRLWDYQSQIPGSNFLSSAVIAGNYIYITGTNKTGTIKKALTIRCDFNGNLIYTIFYQISGNYGISITADNSNNIYVAGRSDLPLNYPKYLVIKYNPNLDSIWTYRYTGIFSGNYDEAQSIKVDISGNVYTSGYTSSGVSNFDSYDYLTIKLNSSGGLVWDRRHDGTVHKQDLAKCLILDANANVFVTGYSYNIAGNTIYTIKYNTNGDSVASVSYSCPGSSLNYPTSCVMDEFKNLYITGLGQCGAGSYFDYLTLKYDTSLALKWYKSCISSANSIAHSISYSNSKVYVTGESDSSNGNRRILTLRYDASNGNELYRWYISTSDSNYAVSVVSDNNDNSFIAGYSTPDTIITSRYSVWADKYYNCRPFGIKRIYGKFPVTFSLGQNYPNPFNPYTLISYTIPLRTFVKLTIYDLNGHEIKVLVNSEQNAGEYNADWDATDFSSGVYFYVLKAGSFKESKKMILIK